MAKEKRAAPAAPPEFKKYETGLQALHKKDHGAALASFEQFIAAHPEHPAAVERARVYRNIALAAQQSKAQPPTDFGEQLLHGIILANRGEHSGAKAQLEKALKADPQSDLGHFLFASVAAEGGDAATAIEHLKVAIQLNPLNRVYAHNLEEFESIRDQSAFQELLSEEAGERGSKK
jgi:tetratricopeptide (TPR) repeat protein